MCITKWQEHIIVLKKDVLASKDLLSSFSKAKNDDITSKGFWTKLRITKAIGRNRW
jgi:hypothetical protein